jgi:TetR/AcrR family transcriptional regulator
MNQDSNTGAIRQRNRQLIINAAVREFAQKGFSGTTVQSIADRAELPKPNVHYYFGSKETLYQEVLTHILSLWDGSLDLLVAEDDPKAFITEYIAKKISFSRENPEASRIFAAEVINGAPHMKKRFGKQYYEWFTGRCDIIKQWQAAGKINPDLSAEHLLFIIWASTQHYADYELQVKAALGQKRLKLEVYEQAEKTLIALVLAGMQIA